MDRSREPLALTRFGWTSDERKGREGGEIHAKAAPPLQALGLAKPFHRFAPPSWLRLATIGL
jgi:hypothetical protein